jgi:alkanesulfonate monooxygenase SsuD/methylene tetrahydromethanopterin reductase-like flavin-dependent oxidoreductase (luciferase family)
MKFGYMYDFRASNRFPTPRPRLYAEGFEHMRTAEALGFASVWAPEHHLSDCGYNPAPLPVIAAMAVQTSRVTIGTSVLLLPFHHPLRVAEEAAAIDNMSNGRLILGLGTGYRIAEFDGYGIERRNRGSMLDEGIEVLLRAWQEESFSHSGRHYVLKNVTIGLRPVQRPHPPIVLAARGPKAAQRAARLGFSIMPTGDRKQVYDDWRQELGALGRTADHPDIYTTMRVIPTRDPEREWHDLSDNVLEESIRVRAWYHEAADNPIDLRQPVLEDREQMKVEERKRLIIGEPAYCIARLKELAESGVNHVILHGSLIGLPHEKALEHMQLFADEVMPQLTHFEPPPLAVEVPPKPS